MSPGSSVAPQRRPPGVTARAGSWARTHGCCSTALAGVYADLGFDALGDEVFRDLVIARVVEPTSLLDNGRVLTDLGRAPASYATMKRTLVRAGSQEVPRPGRHGLLRARVHPRGHLLGAVRRDDVVLRGREGGRPAQGRLLQGAPGRPTGRGRAPGRPGRVPAGDRLL